MLPELFKIKPRHLKLSGILRKGLIANPLSIGTAWTAANKHICLGGADEQAQAHAQMVDADQQELQRKGRPRERDDMIRGLRHQGQDPSARSAS